MDFVAMAVISENDIFISCKKLGIVADNMMWHSPYRPWYFCSSHLSFRCLSRKELVLLVAQTPVPLS